MDHKSHSAGVCSVKAVLIVHPSISKIAKVSIRPSPLPIGHGVCRRGERTEMGPEVRRFEDGR